MMHIHQAGLVANRLELWKGAVVRYFEVEKVDDNSENVPISLEAVMISFALLALGLAISALLALGEKAYGMKFQNTFGKKVK